jgi:UDP-N-acetyl-D-galactosamine dehydrogenase
MLDLNNVRIGVLGLGYVGLPLAVEFGRKISTSSGVRYPPPGWI